MTVGEAFARFGPGLSEALVSQCRERQWRKGDLVSFTGDRHGGALFVSDGQFKVTLGALDGRELLVAIRGKGEVVNELSLLDGAPRSASLTALRAARAWAMPADVFAELLDNDREFARALHVDTVAKLRAATARELELGYDTVAGRVARRLVELAGRFCAEWPDADAPFRFASPITQQELADWSGVTRQAVVKELTSLRDAGVISTAGSTFVIHDPVALVAASRQLLG